jgi:predicted transcriptional regulator
MAETTTITVRISQKARDQLDRMAELTKRCRSYLVAEALDTYLSSDLEIAESIQRGIEDIRAGRTIPHEQVMTELRAIIDRAKKRQQRKPGKAA